MRIVRKGCRDDEQTIIIEGEPGPAGEAATIEIGTVTTLEPGDEAYVENVGDENAAVLNFGIPKGAAGNQGIQGPAGDDGEDGADGADGTAATIEIGTVTTLEPGDEAYVENVGDENAAVFNFGIPKGAKGDQGNPGADGTAATIQIGAVTTLEPGDEAYVENVGDENAAVLNFGIPRGQDGSGGGESNLLVVQMTRISSTEYVANTTAADVITAHEAGKLCVAIANGLTYVFIKKLSGTKIKWQHLEAVGSNGLNLYTMEQTAYSAELAMLQYNDTSKQDTISDLDDIRSGAAAGATALQSVPNTYRTASEQDTIDSGFVKLNGSGGQTVYTNSAVPLSVKNNINGQHKSYLGFATNVDGTIGFLGINNGVPVYLEDDGTTEHSIQTADIADAGGYFTTDTVEGALQEIGAELSGINTLIGSGVIT